MSHKYGISDEVLSGLITEVLSSIEKPDYNSDQELHKKLSQNWVKKFALALEKYYNKKKSLDVISFFNQRDTSDSKTPKIREFLYDITVAEYDSFYSSCKNKLVPFITKPIWQIESEFEQDMREIAKDFQKLISGNAPFKIMAVPYGKNDSQYYKTDMANLAKYVDGELWLILIRPPSKEWLNDSINFQLFKWDNHDWV